MTSRRPSASFADRLFVMAALMWAAVGRLAVPDAYPFAFDEARLSSMALALARHGEWPLLGMVSSAGIPNLPLAVWLFALPYRASADPLVATLFVTYANILAVALIARLAAEMWGREAGWAAAWLAAGSPYLAFYSRNVWAQNWLVPLAALWAFLAWRARRRRSPVAALAAAALAALAPQVHYAGIALWVPTLILAWRDRRNRRAVGAGWLLGLLPAIPSAVAMWQRTPRVGMHMSARLDISSWLHLAQVLTGWGWDEYLIGPAWGLGRGGWAKAAALGVFGLAVAGLVAWGWRFRRRRGEPWAWTYLAWLLATPLLWFLPGVPSRPHYHLPSLPAWLALAGGAATASGPRWRRGALVLAVSVALLHGVLFLRSAQIAATQYTPGGISTPLGPLRRAAQAVRGEDVVVHVPGDDPAVDGDAAVWHVLLWETPHRLVDGRRAMLVPADGGNLLFAASWLPAWEVAQVLWPETRQAAHFLPKRDGELPFVVVDAPRSAPKGLRPAPEGELANAARMVGWRVEPATDHVRLITVWQVPATDGRRYHQFNHLYVPGQQAPVYVQDGPTSSLAWRQGDWLVTWADFPAPLPQAARFGVGMYTYPDLQRVPRISGPDPLAPILLDPGAVWQSP